MPDDTETASYMTLLGFEWHEGVSAWVAPTFIMREWVRPEQAKFFCKSTKLAINKALIDEAEGYGKALGDTARGPYTSRYMRDLYDLRVKMLQKEQGQLK